jgi:hypothetical protein
MLIQDLQGKHNTVQIGINMEITEKVKQFVYTSTKSNNDELIKNAAIIYLKDGQKIADVTWGKGVFWKKIDLNKYDFHKSDLITTPETQYDFRHLPYKDNDFDHVVFDPPYVHNPGRLIVDANYQNAATTKGMYHKDIINLYREGMIEANRILKSDGKLWVKCKDEVESSKQMMSHIEIYDIACKELKMIVEDLFVLTQLQDPIVQHKEQKHARKNHSYLWIFSKLDK